MRRVPTVFDLVGFVAVSVWIAFLAALWREGAGSFAFAALSSRTGSASSTGR
jgi:hypothetical protein